MTIKVYDRVHLDVPGKTLVIELLDGYDGPTGTGDYIDAWRLIDLKTGEVFAMAVRLEWITSHAGDLEHDFKLDGDKRDPIAVATQELNDIYNERPCFYLDRQAGKWLLDEDKC
jgi:hypothetical protein